MNKSNTQSATDVAQTMEKVNTGIIVIPANPSIDAIASATALYIGLSQIGKSSSMVCATPIQSDFTGAEKIQQNLSTPGDSLVISFPYEDGNVDRIDWNIERETFNVIIVPRAGFPKIDSGNVQFSYAGGKTEFICILDAPNLNTLGNVYVANQEEFKGKLIINVDRHMVNSAYGTVNYIDKTASSTSELTMRILQELGCEIDKEIATNLYNGIVAATGNFSSPNVGAHTFQIAATLLQAGAQKKQTLPMGMGGGMPRSKAGGTHNIFGKQSPIPEMNPEHMHDPFTGVNPPLERPSQIRPPRPQQQQSPQGSIQQHPTPEQQDAQHRNFPQQRPRQQKPNVFQDLLNTGKKQ